MGNKIESKQVKRSSNDITQELVTKEYVSEELKKQCLATSIFETTKSHSFIGSVLQVLNISYTHAIPLGSGSYTVELVAAASISVAAYNIESAIVGSFTI